MVWEFKLGNQYSKVILHIFENIRFKNFSLLLESLTERLSNTSSGSGIEQEGEWL